MKYEPSDIIVFILAGTIACLLISSVLAAVITGDKLTEAGLKIVGDMNMAIIAIISMYIGSKLKS